MGHIFDRVTGGSRPALRLSFPRKPRHSATASLEALRIHAGLDDAAAIHARLQSMLREAELDRRELVEVGRALEPLAVQLQQALSHRRAAHGRGREVVVADDAVQRLWACVYAVQLHRPWRPTTYLRDSIWTALQRTEYALTTLRWAVVRDAQQLSDMEDRAA